MEALEKIRYWLIKNQYDGLILTRRDNFTWVMQGKHNYVCTNTDTGIVSILVGKETVRIWGDNIDCKRIAEEENPLGAEALSYPWYEKPEQYLKKLISGQRFVSDTGIADTPNVQEELIAMRLLLTEEEMVRYRRLGAECADIVENICREAKPGQTEKEIAAQVSCACYLKGISPDCVLVGSDERILKYRHPIPTDKRIEKSLMVVLGGERDGLNSSLTRFVYFTAVPNEIWERYQKTRYIFAAMQLLMKDGLSYGAYFECIRDLYERAGYKDEWKLHHQGGPAGYGCREFIITPDCNKRIKNGQAYAWNPSITGAKCEDTTLLNNGRIEILTRTKDWPCPEIKINAAAISVADILIR